MTRYNHDDGDELGDHDDQLAFACLSGYREGVERVIEYVASIHAHPRLVDELRWAIKEGII